MNLQEETRHNLMVRLMAKGLYPETGDCKKVLSPVVMLKSVRTFVHLEWMSRLPF